MNEKQECKVSLSDIYLVCSGDEIHTIRADEWLASGNGLYFSREGKRVACFLEWFWWKRADA